MAPATMAMPMTIQTGTGDSADDVSRLWLERLAASGPEREAAVVEFHGLLLKAARFESSPLRPTPPARRR